MATSVRLKPQTERRLEQAAKRLKKTKSAVIQDAIDEYCERIVPTRSLYERLQPFIGAADGGDPTLSEDTGRKFRAALIEKARKRDGR